MNSMLTGHKSQELEGCKRSFIIIWKGRKQPTIDGVFYNWCRRTKNPYVRIHYTRSCANVSMDLPNASGALDEEGLNKLRKLCLEYGYPDQGKRKLNGADDLPKEEALAFAQRLVEIGHVFCRQNFTPTS